MAKKKSTTKKVMDIKNPNPINRKLTRSETLMRRYVEKPTKKMSTKLTPKISVSDLKGLKSVPANSITAVKHIDKAFKQIPKSHLVTKFQYKVNLEPVLSSKPVQKGIEISKTYTPIITDPAKRLIDKSVDAAYEKDIPLLPKDKNSFRTAFISIVVVVSIIILVSVIGFLYPKIEIYLANHAAGFNATIPSMTPAGYSLGDINAKSAQITINYNSNTSKNKITITEKPSKWDNQTLIQSYLVPNGLITYSDWVYKGITIYSYGTATKPGFTWVNGGIWYVVEGNSLISNNQLENIISTM